MTDVLDDFDQLLKEAFKPDNTKVLEDESTLACMCGVSWTGKTVDFLKSGRFRAFAEKHKPGLGMDGKMHGPERRKHDE